MSHSRFPGNASRSDRVQQLLATAVKHQQVGRLADAERGYRAVVSLESRNVAALNGLGRVQQALGRPAEAAASYRRALAVAPEEPLLFINLGNALVEQDKPADALAAYQHALELRPTMAEAHNNVGSLLHRAGDLVGARDSYERAIRLNPQFAEPYGNLARVFLATGDARAGLRFSSAFLDLAHSETAQRLVVHCLRDLRPQPEDVSLRPLVERALTEGWGRPADLGGIAAFLACLNVANLTGPVAVLTGLAADQLLAALLVATPVVSADLERILTAARRTVLFHADPQPSLLSFVCLLSQQCFLNEYVFVADSAERDLVAALREKRPLSPLELAILGCYEPLFALPDAQSLLQQYWPAEAQAILRQQITEPATERTLRSSIPVLAAVDDTVSQAVRRQYEENPYPRWTRPAPAAPVPSIDHLLHAQCPSAAFVPLQKPRGLDVLIAGCGTGRQPLEVARQLPGARVLAVDLSLASLCYARRKASELAVPNIEFAQADLLRLDGFRRRFDMIQATGVLHHLADPMQGWRVLTGMLRPRGVMHVGLYSEFARRPVAAARDFIAARGFPDTPDGIRQCRQESRVLQDHSLGWVTSSRDFYYLSGCRDLLFHVQESGFTLPRIGECLAELGLTFLGFELDPAVAADYRSHNPQDPSLTDLAGWHAFELDKPDTFRSMYQFWMQKPA